MAVKKLLLISLLSLLAVPITTYAAAATYPNNTPTNIPRQSSVNVRSNIEVPTEDNFAITDLNVTVNISGADLSRLDVGLTSSQGNRIILSPRGFLNGVNFSGTIFDDEASKTLSQGSQPWRGNFKPNQPLSTFDGQTMAGTWILDITGNNANGSSSAKLNSWTLTAEGADSATIQGTKFHDKNSNGTKDNSEPGLSNWTLYLDQNNNQAQDSGEASTTTDSNGSYQFADLAITDYIVREVEQADWPDVAPGSETHRVRTHHGETISDTNFGNIPISETTLATYTQGTANNHSLAIEDSFLIADLNIELHIMGATLANERFVLRSPAGTEVELYNKQVNGSNMITTVFDDEATKTINEGVQAWRGSFQPNQPLGAFNSQVTKGTWQLIGPNTGQLVSWKLHIRSPVTQEPDPIILVPGMMASLNPKVTLANGVGGKWDFAPFARKDYQGLIDRLAQQGFIENQNLFIAHYDWRNSVTDSATNYLKPVISQAKQTTSADKVDIITHSMGGIVARSYAQSSQYENDVDQLITLGTPHLGASDAYNVWEGGILPERWGKAIRLYLTIVERSLSSISLDPAKPRPLSFRQFFPSLRDLLPTEDFIIRNNTSFPVGNQTEQNFFLQTLKSTVNRLTDRSVNVTTIAGNSLPTLNQIFLTGNRTNEDIAKQRWRDGHPNPDPPVANTTLGDQTVLLSSALFGNNTITKTSIPHDKLPEEAQEEVLEALGLDSSGPHIAYDTPDSLVGTVVLSPVTPSITLPNGTTFTCDANKQTSNAECVVDETDPNGPKLLVMADPANGQYKLTFTGTGNGEYHAITCFADSDSNNCSTREGQTKPGQKDTSTFVIGGGTYTAPAGDVLALLKQLKDRLFNLLLDHHIEVAGSKLHGIATRLHSFGENYAKEAKKNPTSSKAKSWYKKMQADFDWLESEIEKQIAAGNLDDTAILEITSLRDQLIEIGL